MDEEAKNSRGRFLKAGLLVGGALYADPTSALARTGSHLFLPPGGVEYPKDTPIGKYVSGLNDNAGNLTLGDLRAIAETDVAQIQKLGKKFSQVTYSDLGDIVTAAINQNATDPQLIVIGPGGVRVVVSC